MYPQKSVATAALLLVFGLSWIHPIWPMEQALHSSLTVAGILVLWRHARRHAMSDRDFFLVVVFLSIHCVAARWIYSYVPYDAWLQSTFGLSVNQQLGWTRNNFDRLVHFMYGLCLTPAIASLAIHRFTRTPGAAFLVAVISIMLTSLWYEWFEFGIAIALSSESAEAYNGQQGDVWDAHKDMLIATLGSLAWAWHYLKRRPPHPSPSTSR